MAAYEVNQLRSLFPEDAINDINGYMVGILKKIMDASYSFIIVIEHAHDYSSAATILRSIADNLASYILIYHEKNKDELLLRHHLFLIDGLRARLNGRQSIKPDPNIPLSKTEKDSLREITEAATIDDKKYIDYCLKSIRSNKLYENHKTEIEYLINKKSDNWKYTSLNQYKEQYSWANLYPKINGKDASKTFFSFLSQYVHGLSASNLSRDLNNADTYNELLGIGITFLGKVIEFAEHDFNIGRKILLQDFFQSDYGKDHLSCVNPQYLEAFLKKHTSQ